MPLGILSHKVLQDRQRSLMVAVSFIPDQMVIFTATNYGCVFTLSKEDGDELFYAPIYADGSINLNEFAPVDMESVDMDDMELFDIRNRLVEMCQV
jgi:hypothetical protein